MKVVVAIDSFKGSMTSKEAGEAAKEGVLKVFPDAEVIVKPLADGGEGTMSALVEGLNGEIKEIAVKDPLGNPVKAKYGIINNDTAVIEIAEASGITLIESDKLDPYKTNTFGTGQIINDALNMGINNIIIGLGGSATTEGGIGMLEALGAKFYDSDFNELPPEFASLDKVEKIDISNLNPNLKNAQFLIASDVKNPLTGPNGAISIFGPQKGVKPEDISQMDKTMEHYASVVKDELDKDVATADGSGAAGGLGFAFLSFIPNVELKPGIDLILNYLNFKDDLINADYLITGEGRLDDQTAMGKVPVGIAKLAKEVGNAKTIAFAGSITDDASNCNENNIDAFFPIVRGVSTLEEAMDNGTAKENMKKAVEQVFRLFK